MDPDESSEPTTALVDRLINEYGVGQATAEEVVARYFQVSPYPPPRLQAHEAFKQWVEQEAEEIYSNPRWWD